MQEPLLTGDLAELQRIVAKEFETRAADAMARRGKFVIALPGGSVAPAFFPTLAAAAIDWSRTDVFWIDERAVPPDHPDSNYALASRLLLTPARVPVERIHRMQGELPDLGEAASRAADELKSIAGYPPQLDLVIVGVGVDGHIASIFNVERRWVGMSLAAAKREIPLVIPVYKSPKPPPRRLTMAFPVIANADLVLIIALGSEKAPVMRAALDGSGTTPVAELLRFARSPLVLLDRAAALS